jgi:hypothetical protein
VNLSCFEKTNMNCSQEDDHIVHSKEYHSCRAKKGWNVFPKSRR